MKVPVRIEDIVNQDYCVSTILLKNLNQSNEFTLTPSQIFDDLKSEIGVYQLWEKVDYCADHPDQVKIECIYVGETGDSIITRIKGHLKDKWDQEEEMWVTFYPCEKRIAVYLEQLLLDVYSLKHNKKGNTGNVVLEVFYPSELLLTPTNAHETAEMLAVEFPEVFDEPLN